MKSFPWDSTAEGLDEDGFPKYDRASSAADLQGIFGRFFSDGVTMDTGAALQVVAGSGMNVTVKPGWCCIKGTFGVEDKDRTLAVQGSDPSQDRIDTVVARWNRNVNARYVELYVVKGTPAPKPTRPALTRNASVHEIGLADVFIPAGSGAITQQRITDTRLETGRCGAMAPFEEIDTAEVVEQINAFFADYKARAEREYGDYKTQNQAAFGQWFDSIKGKLDGDAATKLQKQIDDITYYYVQDGTLFVPNTSTSVSDGVLTLGTTKKPDVMLL